MASPLLPLFIAETPARPDTGRVMVFAAQGNPIA
jgi:hypothetical protein